MKRKIRVNEMALGCGFLLKQKLSIAFPNLSDFL
jgi:hypothetical protein